MLKSICIDGFRRYKHFRIDDFGRINFILGDNNIGKTSILEAIFAWAFGLNAVPFINIPLSRGRYSNIQHPYWIMEELLSTFNDRKTIPLRMSLEGVYDDKSICFEHSVYPSTLLSEYDTSYKNAPNLIERSSAGLVSAPIQNQSGFFNIHPISIAKWDISKNKNKNKSSSMTFTIPFTQISTEAPFVAAKFIDVLSHTSIAENVQIYASLKREQLLDEVASEINRIFPEVVGFDMIPYPDGSQAPVSVVKKDGLLPLYACGDGIQRWFFIQGCLTLYKNSIICIDEIDTGFHPSAQADFSATLVRNAIKNGVQLFITTHNIEFIDSFLRSNESLTEKEKSDVRIITLREVEGCLKARSLIAEEALRDRNDFNLELR